MSSFGAVIDACVLIDASLRDTLFRAYRAGLYRLYWSDDILREVQTTLVRETLTTDEGAERLIATIRTVLEAAEVSDYSHLNASMPVNPKDQHVLATAVAASAQVIVTKNLRDFPQSSLRRYGLEAQSPDEFLVDLFDLDPEAMMQVIEEQSNALRNPPMTVAEVLNTLDARGATRFTALLRARWNLDVP